MIHGGGHIMLSRKDIRPEQTNMLLRSGFLPVSIDYRLCPETNIREGPMIDVVDALAWARNVLPELRLARQDVLVDGEKVVTVGWSTGGTLAMSLGWTSIPLGVRPPDAILVFYCPTDYEDPFWTKPNIPAGSEGHSSSSYELDDDTWASLFDKPITSYNVATTKRAVGGWLAPSDARSRLALYMNWQGRTLQVLLNGLDKSQRSECEEILNQDPLPSDVAAISPLAHIRNGTYATPTFVIHPRQDDLIPWQQAQRTWEALHAQGIDAELRIVEEGPHLFDMYRQFSSQEAVKAAVSDGYSFLCKYAGL
jgi:acetyl esterase/lipase